MNPYKQEDLRAAWRAGRRAKQSRLYREHWQAWKRGFNSVDAERVTAWYAAQEAKTK